MSTLDPRQLDRAIGVMLGSAAGDALGSQYEFGPAHDDAFEPEFGVGVFGHGIGEWTDDTSMAIPILQALAAGLSLSGPGALGQIVQDWREWSVDAKDVGAQTRDVLSRMTAPTAEAAFAQSKLSHEQAGRSGGNGSLMRTAPVAIGYLAGSPAELAEAAGRVAQLTHWELDNVDACALWCLAIRHAILTGELDIRGQLDWVPAERRARWSGLIDEALAPDAHPRDFRESNGWVVRALQGALAAVAGASSVRESVERAVRGGGDTDTVAAIAGALAGAVHGGSTVPASWVRVLHGWPGLDSADLERLVTSAVRAGS